MRQTSETRAEIDCPMFLRWEGVINKLIREINAAKGIAAKAERAAHLENEVELLLSCERFDENNEDCKNCRSISALRRQVAEILLNMKGSGE